MIACLRFPCFAPRLHQSEDPTPNAVPLIIHNAQSKVVAVSEGVVRAGLKPGMPLPQAQLLCPGVHHIPADVGRYRQVTDRLLQSLLTFTNRLELDENAQTLTVWLDLGPGADDLAVELGRAARKSVGFNPTLGLSSGKFPALVAAMTAQPGRALVVRPGQERSFLAPFPARLLSLDEETAHWLNLLGLRTLGQLADLPAGAMLDQFGWPGRIWHRLAQGIDDRPVQIWPPPLSLEQSHAFEPPLADRLVLSRVIEKLADTLAADLGGRGRMSGELKLALHLENGTEIVRENTLSQPVVSAAQLKTHLAGLLESLAITHGVIELTLTLARLRPLLPRQLSLFGQQNEPQDKLTPILSSLVARYGRGCFYHVSMSNGNAQIPQRRFRLWEVDAA